MDTNLTLNLFVLSEPLAWLGTLAFGALVVAPAWTTLRRRGRD